jgi:hypothetical protein
MKRVFADTFFFLAYLNSGEALTGDHHFEQAGFVLLLRD